MCIYWLYYVTCSYIYFITHAKLKNTAAPLKTGLDFSSLRNFFFSLNNAKKKMYANVLEMFSFDSKTSIRRYPIFFSWYNFFSVNVSDFYRYFTAQN